MKNRQIAALFLCGAMSLSLLAGCGSTAQNSNAADTDSGALSIAEQGIFSAGGITVTSDGTFNPEDQWEETGAGQTAHVDHANVLYQIPEDETGLPMVFLHGYGQSRMG
ncbi:MAG: alpha/beta hydrolase, partial [Butyricicoccus sp.]